MKKRFVILIAVLSMLFGVLVGGFSFGRMSARSESEDVSKAAQIVVAAHKSRDMATISKIDAMISNYEGIDDGSKVCKSIAQLKKKP